jgi:5-hydroxyisourate hydrolase
MTAISTHVLDTALGRPAAGINIWIERREGETWNKIASSETDADGRCRELANAVEGVYRITFFSGEYLSRLGRSSIFQEISVLFSCAGETHFHLPLLLSDNSYTTYRGS